MKHLRRIAAALLLLAATAAQAQPLPNLTFRDLAGGTHALPAEWRGTGGILILGFSRDAADTMDQWIIALGLDENDVWISSPVVGNVPGLVRSMIQGGMRNRYPENRRAHIAPVFQGVEAIERLAASRRADVVVLAVSANGEIIARAEGAVTPAAVTRLRQALPE